MHIKRTHTEEVGPSRFSKFEVGLDQEDVARLLTEHLPGVDPHAVSVRDVFMLVEYEAAILLLLGRRARFGMSEVKSEELLAEARRAQDFLSGHIQRLKEKHASV